MKRGVAECPSRFEREACLNHANMVGFRFVGGNRMAFVLGMVVKGFRLLPPSQHLGKNGPWNVRQMGNIDPNVRRPPGFGASKRR